MNATEKKEQVSLRLSATLLDKLKEIAKEDNKSLNQVIEETLEKTHLLANKYQIFKEAEEQYIGKMYSQGGGHSVVSSPVEYLISNGIDWMFVDSIEGFPINKEDYVFECFTTNGDPRVKLIRS